jgi:K+-transporting ATPase KdpF subunit
MGVVMDVVMVVLSACVAAYLLYAVVRPERF